MREAGIELLEGKVLKSIKINEAKDEVTFTTDTDEEYLMYHSSDCCESVSLHDITGDLKDLLNNPILQAEESSSNETPAGIANEYEPESQTWTFYKLATIKGSVTLRWWGTSNGYYSESVSFVKSVDKDKY